MTGLLYAVGFALIFGWLVPYAGMRMLWPAIEGSGRSVRNYRGRAVFLGLGLVWVFWYASMRVVGPSGAGLFVVYNMLPHIEPALMDSLISIDRASLTVVWALLFGLIDDVWGSATAKGFTGHIRALLSGRITTGALKLFGIGFVALAGGVGLAFDRARGSLDVDSLEYVVTWVSATLVIALSANLLNLFDLRPGRALKVYTAFALVAAVALGIGSALAPEDAFSSALIVFLWMLGPVVAVWRYDLGEYGMLGDAGANAAGVLAGFVLAWALPTTGLVAAALVLLGLNALSEKVSFSRIIESNGVLRWIDSLGRSSVGQ